ncbi:MAG: RidA family protein [Planctomycetota bacterium]|jgi:enamine deaminase RidA (YjgF/YER057c/UK114 family)
MDQDNKAFAEITKIASDELDVVTVSRRCCKKFYITAHPGKDGRHYSMFDSLGAFLRENNAGIVTQSVFGACELHSDGMKALADACGQVNWPVTWIEGVGPVGKNLTGTQVYAISDITVKPVQLDGRVIGGVFEDDNAVYCLLGDLRPREISRSREAQAQATFESIETVLGTIGMNFSNVVRTWFYIDDILDWYTEFNTIRNDFFKLRGVFDGVVPASTGIGVANPAGAALVGEVFAVKAKNSHNVEVRAVGSPLQCPAIDYKSSFSRAVEVVLPDHRRLYVSGTASIEPAGATAYVGDVKKQIALTMEVAGAILESRKMAWSDTSRAIGYFKDIENAPLLGGYCRRQGLAHVPIAVAHGDICRDDLLFEIELDAVSAR